MSKSYHLTVCFLSLLTFSGCESDEAKLQRLRSEQTMACLLARSYQRDVVNSNLNRATITYSDTLGRRAREYQVKCELATRNLDRFMR